MAERHPVWFERPVLPDLLDEVRARADILGPTGDDPYAGLERAEGAIAGATPYGAPFMDRAPRLRVIARTGIGVDLVDVTEATRRGIAVCNAPDAPTVSTAEHAVALMLTVAKNIKRSEGGLRAGASNLYAGYSGMELAGKTLGLVGYGRIAQRVAAIGRGLGMQVTAFDPFLDRTAFGETTPVETQADLLATADVVSLHVPLAADTARFFGAAEFAAMRGGAIFINTARGGLVDHEALLDALEAGKLLGAGLDVTDPEPLPPDHPLLHRDDTVITPHVASGTHDGKRRLFRAAFAQAVQVLDGERPPHLINPEIWTREELTT
jgi:phosphoglycerate dehydrogenase-like enzyme